MSCVSTIREEPIPFTCRSAVVFMLLGRESMEEFEALCRQRGLPPYFPSVVDQAGPFLVASSDFDTSPAEAPAMQEAKADVLAWLAEKSDPTAGVRIMLSSELASNQMEEHPSPSERLAVHLRAEGFLVCPWPSHLLVVATAGLLVRVVYERLTNSRSATVPAGRKEHAD